MPEVPHPTRFRLRNRELLRTIMKHPGCGTPYTVRALAEAATCSPTIVGHLRSGGRDTASSEHAHAISEALGVGVRVLFVPPLSQDPDDASNDSYED